MAALVPIPRSVSAGTTAQDPFAFSGTTRLVAGAGTEATARLAAAALAPVCGRTLEVASGGASAADIALQIAGEGSAESYTLTVAADGVRVVGADEAGLFYGVQTLVQLLAASGDAVPPIRIEDAPRFAYRGVMLDVARHFFPVEVVEGFIDRAAALKFNVLHLHLTDDQGWRLHVDSRPELTAHASASAIGGDAGGFYSKADYAHIVAYATARHLTVVPEIDGPSHTHAVGLAYPHLVEAPVITDLIRDTIAGYGGGLPEAGLPYTGLAVGFSSLRIGDEATYDFLADVYGELAAMTPGPYLHIGGDEPLGTDPDDYAVYVQRVTRLVSDLGKTPVAWHEAGAVAGLADDTIGQYWGFVAPTNGMDEKTRTFVRNGAQVILSPADAVYLDMKNDPTGELGLTWANGPTSLERSYDWEPAALIDGVGEDDILGIEAPLWTETVRTAADIDELTFPRIASAAEIAWSPADGVERTWGSFRDRVGALGALWQLQGIGYFASPQVDWTEPAEAAQ